MNGYEQTTPHQKTKLEKAALDYSDATDNEADEMAQGYWQLAKYAADNNLPLELQAELEEKAIEWETKAHPDECGCFLPDDACQACANAADDGKEEIPY